jgi:uncharacterized low-complexity protein
MKTTLKLATLAALTTATLALPVAAQNANNATKCQPAAAAKCGARKCAAKCGAKKCAPAAKCGANKCAPKCAPKCGAKK